MFHSFEASIRKIYSGLKFAGKGYSVTSLQNHISRYYTICNCMSSNFLNEYMTAFSCAMNQGTYSRKYQTFDEAASLADSYLELVMKHYPQSQFGISNQVFSSVGTDYFYIHGPIGKGLEIDRFNSSGINLIFVGGTGILPFMDLFAYIGRKVLKENAAEYSLFPDEVFDDLSDTAEFVIYGYFPTKADCIGIDFVQAIERLCDKYGRKSTFTLNLILTKQDGHRHTNEELIDVISHHHKKHGRINKLWVCGPPPMNYQFQRLMPSIVEKTKLDFEDFCIF